MTNFEKIKGFKFNEMVKFLSECEGDGCAAPYPWDIITDTACQNCQCVEKDGHEYSYCELYGCPRGYDEMPDEDIIRMWLRAEA